MEAQTNNHPNVNALNSTSAADPVTDLGSRLQLMLDRSVIDSMEGVELRLHEPVPQPLPKCPLIGRYATVIKDGGLYRAWYRDRDPSYTGDPVSGNPGEITCYAESRDGREWVFPKVGIYEINGSKDNNVVLAGQSPFSTNLAPFLDTRPGVKPDERFKAVAGHPGFDRENSAPGLFAFVSRDGLHWKKFSESEIIPYRPEWTHAFDSQNVAFWSEVEGQYVCYFRTWMKPKNVDAKVGGIEDKESGRKGTLRSISRATSKDFLNWSEPVAMDPNVPREHLYTNQTHPYFRAPHLYIALPTRYVAGRVSGQKTNAMLGSTDVMLMTSRAGSTTYDRLFTEAFLRPGLDPARWESRANYVSQNIVPTGPQEMSIYHYISGQRYTLRTDGFVSVRAGSQSGEFLTRPLQFSGSQLVINASTAAAGSVQVEIQSADGTPIPGFSLEDSEPFVGDNIAHPVSWKNEARLTELAGQPVRLRFVLKETDLYSFQFQENTAAE